MKILFPILIILLSIILNAQDTTQTTVNNIYWKWPHYRMYGKRINGRQLQTELNKYPTSAKYYKEAKKNLTVGVLSYIPLTVCVLLLKPENSYLYRPGKNTPFYAGITLSGGVILYSMIRHKSFMKKAMNNYNENSVIIY